MYNERGSKQQRPNYIGGMGKAQDRTRNRARPGHGTRARVLAAPCAVLAEVLFSERMEWPTGFSCGSKKTNGIWLKKKIIEVEWQQEH